MKTNSIKSDDQVAIKLITIAATLDPINISTRKNEIQFLLDHLLTIKKLLGDDEMMAECLFFDPTICLAPDFTFSCEAAAELHEASAGLLADKSVCVTFWELIL